jgi:hypothetical protein
LSEEEFRRSVRKRRRFRIGLAVSAVGLAALGTIFYALRPSSPLDEPPLPNPNGYDDLVRAGHAIVGRVPGPKGDYQTAGADELRKWVDANQEELMNARSGLDRECRVALPPSEKQLQAHMAKSSDLRQLCRLMGAAARLAEIEGERPQAIRNGLDVIEVAQRGTRGGLIIDAMTGFACESVGQRILARLRDQLTVEECRTLVTALEAIDEKREPVAKVVKRDRAWFSAAQNLFTRTILSVNSTAVSQLLKPAIDSLELISHRSIARLRLLTAELAIRRYRLENGTDPPSLEALAPRYLAKVPADPYSGRAIRYRLDQSQGHHLYCVGPDGRDDDGKPLPERSDWSKARGDVLVDPGEVLLPPSSAASQLRTPFAETP